MINFHLLVPRCWQSLIQVDDLSDALSEKEDHTGTADPKPHYDDARQVGAKNEEGYYCELELCSGQSNYFGGCTIFSPEGEIVAQTEPWESFDEVNDVTGDNGEDFVINIKFVDEWEEV